MMMMMINDDDDDDNDDDDNDDGDDVDRKRCAGAEPATNIVTEIYLFFGDPNKSGWT